MAKSPCTIPDWGMLLYLWSRIFSLGLSLSTLECKTENFPSNLTKSFRVSCNLLESHTRGDAMLVVAYHGGIRIILSSIGFKDLFQKGMYGIIMTYLYSPLCCSHFHKCRGLSSNLRFVCELRGNSEAPFVHLGKE